MKTAFHMLLLLVPFLTNSCREGNDAPKNEKLDRLIFRPEVEETWVYDVTVTLDPSARNREGVIQAGPEGASTTYSKIRRYLGRKPVEPGGGEQTADCFEITEKGKVKELEFSILTEEGLMSCAWQLAGQDRLIMNEPVLLVPADKVPGAVWPLIFPNPNNPAGPALFSRNFHYYGIDKVDVMGELRDAHRVKVIGKTGGLDLQRDYWFVNKIGFVKERKAYYSKDVRLALVEEILVEHKKPK